MSAGNATRMRPFDRSLPMQLMRAREAVMQRFRPHLTARGLTDQQWRVIRALNEASDLDIVALGERCCIHPASLSRMLRRLERERLIARRINRKDQRRAAVSLTARGRKLFGTLAPESEDIYAQLERDIGREQLHDLYHVLGRMIDALAANGRTNGVGTGGHKR
jgi:homoprotocatechuate degradation regulator HpaR